LRRPDSNFKWRKSAGAGHFGPNPKKPKQIGGVTMATDIVTKAPYFKVKKKKSQLEKSWSSLKSSAPFLYLIYVQKHPFRIYKPAGKHIGERFLTKILNREDLHEFFTSYNFLIQILAERGYRYTSVELPKNLEPKPFTRDLFNKNKPPENQILEMIERYTK
jgi:hypothetical protein